MAVGELCTRDVVVARPEEPVEVLAQLMRHFHVGDVVIIEEHDEDRIPLGIVTDRDLVVEVLAEGVDPRTLTASDLIAGELVTVADNEDALAATELMRRKGVRRLVVVDSRCNLVGVLTADDVLDTLAEEMGNLAALLPREIAREEAKRVAL